jgi:hypothetical protein
MAKEPFDRDAMARWYAKQHLKTDPSVREIYYLQRDVPDREIRFVEISDLIAEINDEALEPLDFGVNRGAESDPAMGIWLMSPICWLALPGRVPPWSTCDIPLEVTPWISRSLT